MKRTTATISVFLFFLLLTTTTSTYAQTTYEDNSGFFTPVVESFYLQGGIFEDAQLIGPAVGYRFNKQYDVSLHTEFLFSEWKFNNSDNPELSMLNLGITAGQTNYWSNNILLRNELSVYHSFNLNLNNHQGIATPSLTSLLGASSLYKSLPISDAITFMPNFGVLIGLGDYQPPYSSANLRQGFDGFVAGPQLGLDTKFSFGDSFSITAKPQYRLRYNFNHDHSEGTLTFNVIFNL